MVKYQAAWRLYHYNPLTLNLTLKHPCKCPCFGGLVSHHFQPYLLEIIYPQLGDVGAGGDPLVIGVPT